MEGTAASSTSVLSPASVNEDRLIPYLADLVARVKSIRREAEPYVSLREVSLLWSPKPGKVWSVGEILDHLNKVSDLMQPRVEKSIAAVRLYGSMSSEPPQYDPRERLLVWAMAGKLPMEIRVPTPERYLPTKPTNPHETLAHFLDALDRLMDDLRVANGVLLTDDRTRIASPVKEDVILSLGGWLELLVRHTEYHWGQVRKLRQNPKFAR